jgi:type I restriction enzyme S subunit
MIDTWKKYEFSDCLVDNNVGRANQINASEIKKEGRFPVVDQGQDFIAGYSDEENKLVEKGLPYVIFGDHTRCLKFVEFPFIVGADGTKVLSPNIKLFDPKYFYYQLLSFDIPSRGYNRHYKLLKEKTIQKPELSEQRKIAYILSMVQKAIEQQDKLIHHTTELKKALMQKLFTEGTKGEKQKQTEIGLVPESWEVQPFENTGDVVYGIQAAVASNLKPIGHKILTNKNITIDGKIVLEKINYFKLKSKRHFDTILQKGDLLFNWRSGSKEHVGKTAIFDLEDAEYVHSSFILRIRVNKNHNAKFLFFYLNYLREIGYYQKVQTFSINAKFNKSAINAMPIALPKRNIQDLIANALEAVDTKIDNQIANNNLKNNLFKTLLHELMIGEKRVHEIEFENQLATL